MKHTVLIGGICAAFISFAVHADTLLRIKCYDDNQGAEVFVNGQFKDYCRGDISFFIPAGNVRLLARKSITEDYERVFVQELQVVEGAMPIVEIKLSAPQHPLEAPIQEIRRLKARPF